MKKAVLPKVKKMLTEDKSKADPMEKKAVKAGKAKMAKKSGRGR